MLAIPVSAAEEEELVLQDGSADGAAETILNRTREDGRGTAGGGWILIGGAEAEEGTFLLIFERAQELALVELKGAAMELIGTRLGDVVNDRAGVAAVLGAEVVGDDLNFADGVLVAEEGLGSADGVVVIGLAIEFGIVESAALAVDGVVVAVAVGEAVGVGADDAGNDFGDGIEAVVERETLKVLRAKGGGDLRFGGVRRVAAEPFTSTTWVEPILRVRDLRSAVTPESTGTSLTVAGVNPWASILTE
jgi:hypothetical protein